MFHSIKGILEEIHPSHLIIGTDVFEYKILIPGSILPDLPALGEAVKLFLSPIFREDDVLLIGFTDEQGREIFENVMKVNGIGPKTALALIGELGSSELVRAVQQGDLKTLTKAPGIGKKGAERIVLELKDVFGKLSFDVSESPLGASLSIQKEDALFEEAIDAMLALGFPYAQARELVSSSMDDGITIEELLKRALSGSA